MQDLVCILPPTEAHPEGEALSGPDAYMALVHQLAVGMANNREMSPKGNEAIARLIQQLRGFAETGLSPSDLPIEEAMANVVSIQFDFASRIAADFDTILSNAQSRVRSVQLLTAGDVRFKIATCARVLAGLLAQYREELVVEETGQVPDHEKRRRQNPPGDFVNQDVVKAWRDGAVIGCGHCSQSLNSVLEGVNMKVVKSVACEYCRSVNDLADVG